MHTSELEEYKTEIARLRKEVDEWKKKYFDCRRKVVAQAQYVCEINYFLIHTVSPFGVSVFYFNLFHTCQFIIILNIITIVILSQIPP